MSTNDTTTRVSAAIGERSRQQQNWNKEGSKTLRRLADAAAMSGFAKTYKPVDDEGRKLDPQSQPVRDSAREALAEFLQQATERFDAEATVDYANRDGKASVTVDGQVLLEDAPTPFLLFLENQVEHVIAFLRDAATLPADQTWAWDESQSYYRSAPSTTIRTEPSYDHKIITPNEVKDGHAFPANYEKVKVDVHVGDWTTMLFNGALSVPEKKKLIAKGEKLLSAIKTAREEANSRKVPVQRVGDGLLRWWLG